MKQLFLTLTLLFITTNTLADDQWICSGYTRLGVFASAPEACTAAGNANSPPFVATTADSISCQSPTGSIFCTLSKKAHTTHCSASGTIKSSGYYNLGTNEDAAIPTSTCDSSCATSYTGYGVTKRAMINGIYNYYFGEGSYSFTGQPCTVGTASPSSGSIPPTTCNPTTQDTGQVNGVTVCIDKQTTDSSNTTTTPPTTNADGSSSTVTTTSSTNQTDNTKQTTTTTSTTAVDGTVTTSTQTNTEPLTPPDSFCSKNPTDPSCNKPSDACEKNPDLVGCHTLGTAPAAENMPSSITNISFSPVPIASNSSCPADQTFTVGGKPITVSFEFICKYAQAFKPLVVAIAMLSGLLIVASSFRD